MKTFILFHEDKNQRIDWSKKKALVCLPDTKGKQ